MFSRQHSHLSAPLIPPLSGFHLSHLRGVLTRMKRSGMTIHTGRCALAKQETLYLGYVVGRGVIHL